MTAIKLDSRIGSAAGAALEPHVPSWYRKPGVRAVGIVELAHVERVQPAPDSDKEASVKMRITHLEIPTVEQEDVIREAQRALYLQRTATGTLTDTGEIELAEQTLRLTGGQLHAIESARLRAALTHWASYAERANWDDKLTITQVRHELDTIAKGLNAALHRTANGHGDDD